MKVRELRELLTMYDDELEVIFEQYSGYTRLNEHQISLIEAVDQRDYIERYYSYQYDEDKQPELITFLAFPGN